MSSPMVTRPERRISTPPAAAADDERASLHQATRVHRLKVNAAAWVVGTTIVTVAWIAHEWNANGAFERFAHGGDHGDWNPTLWAFVVLVWALVVGIMALRVHFRRPVTAVEIDDEVERTRLEHRGRLKFHAAAWVLGMILLTPLNVLIEWQDNGGFKRISGNSRPGSWDPWILYAGGIWALVIAIVFALPAYLERRKTVTR